MGSSVLYRDELIDDSILVPRPEIPVILWPETRGRFVVDGSRETPIRTFEYESHVVAESAVEFGRAARNMAEFELNGLSEAEREIVSEAIEEGVYVVWDDEPVPDAMYRLAGRFEDQEHIVHPDEELIANDSESAQNETLSGEYVVRYEGNLYWIHLFLQNEDEAQTN